MMIVMMISCFSMQVTISLLHLLARNCKSHIVYFSIAPSVFIENVHEVGKTNESSTWRPPLTTITVSKKRKWLQQSALGKNHCTKEEPQGMLGAEEEGNQGSHQQPPPPSPSPDHLRPPGGAHPRPVRLQLPQVSFKPV